MVDEVGVARCEGEDGRRGKEESARVAVSQSWPSWQHRARGFHRRALMTLRLVNLEASFGSLVGRPSSLNVLTY